MIFVSAIFARATLTAKMALTAKMRELHLLPKWRPTRVHKKSRTQFWLSDSSGSSELKQVTFLTTRTSTGSKVDVFHQSQPLTQSSDITHAVRVVKNVTCLSSLLAKIRYYKDVPLWENYVRDFFIAAILPVSVKFVI
jgi:hypothetical protein